MLKLHVTTKYLFWGLQEDCEMWRRRQRKQEGYLVSTQTMLQHGRNHTLSIHEG